MRNRTSLSTNTLSWTLLALVAAAVSACSTASDNRASTEESAKGAATGTFTRDSADLDPGARLDIDPAPAPGVSDEAPITEVVVADFTADTAADAQPGRKGGPHATGLPKFAAATVLAAFQRMRRYYHTIPYEVSKGGDVWVKAEGGRGLLMDDYSKLSGGQGDSDQLNWATSDDGQDGGNNGVMPEHWSEIQAHFYMMAPHYRHACWTSIVSGCKRELVGAICGGHEPASTTCGGGAPQYQVEQLSSYNLLWVNPKTSRFIALPEAIRTTTDLSKAQAFSQAQKKAGYVNVWDYVMVRGLWQFNWAQQQAVMNAYYGENKRFSPDPKESAVPFDPNVKADCTKWRPLRRNDPRDGTQCRVDKVFTTGLKSIGR